MRTGPQPGPSSLCGRTRAPVCYSSTIRGFYYHYTCLVCTELIETSSKCLLERACLLLLRQACCCPVIELLYQLIHLTRRLCADCRIRLVSQPLQRTDTGKTNLELPAAPALCPSPLPLLSAPACEATPRAVPAPLSWPWFAPCAPGRSRDPCCCCYCRPPCA